MFAAALPMAILPSPPGAREFNQLFRISITNQHQAVSTGVGLFSLYERELQRPVVITFTLSFELVSLHS